jgi:hypothetical protein
MRSGPVSRLGQAARSQLRAHTPADLISRAVGRCSRLLGRDRARPDAVLLGPWTNAFRWNLWPALPAACVDPLLFLFQVSVLVASSGPVSRWRSVCVALPSFTFRFLCLYTWLDLPCGFCFLCDTSTFVHDGFDWA